MPQVQRCESGHRQQLDKRTHIHTIYKVK